jgi:hypothetical protein
MVQRLRRMATSGRLEGLEELLRRRLAARALTWLWLESDTTVSRLLDSRWLDALIGAQKPRLTRITFLQLVQLYFRRFDKLGEEESNRSAELRAALESHLFWQLAEMPAARSTDGRADPVASLKREAHWMLGLDGPRLLATWTRDQGKELSTVFAEMGLSGFDVGRFGDVCRAHFYLDRLRELPIGQADEVFDELLKPAVAKVPFEGDRRIGHAALEILIDRAGTEPVEAWQNFILALAGDPRISSAATNYQEWWRPLGEERIQRVRGWLSKEDLKLFLQAVEQYGKEERNLELQRMFPARKIFLEGLFKIGLIRNTRLMLGRRAYSSVRRILSAEVQTSFATMDGPMADKAVIYLDCGDFCLVEGSHSFKIWVYLAPPARSLLSYEKNTFSHSDLIRWLPREYQRTYPNLEHLAVVHSAMWQRKVFDFLASNGVALDIEQLLSKPDYKYYLRNFGLPVVSGKATRPRPLPVVAQQPTSETARRTHASDIVSTGPQHAQESSSVASRRDGAQLHESHLAVLIYLADNPGSTVQQISGSVFPAGTSMSTVQQILYKDLRSFASCVSFKYWSLSESGKILLSSASDRSEGDPNSDARQRIEKLIGTLGEFDLKLLRYIIANPGQKMRRAAIVLGVETTDVNRVLYGKLRALCTQSKDYGWTVNEGVEEALHKLADK